MPDIAELSLEDQCSAIWDATIRHQKEMQELRDEGEIVRLWDGEWGLQHVVGDEYQSSWKWKSNDTGPGSLEIPYESVAGYWIYDMWGRMERGEKRNVHVTVDYCGARWGGRLADVSVENREDGDKVIVAEFDHDYENVKWVTVWANPFL